MIDSALFLFILACIWLILPISDQFSTYCILWTCGLFCLICVWFMQPGFYQCDKYLIPATCVWSILHVFKWFWLPLIYSIHLPVHDLLCMYLMIKHFCACINSNVYSWFELYMISLPGAGLIQYVVCRFHMFMTNSTCIWSIHTVSNLFSI